MKTISYILILISILFSNLKYSYSVAAENLLMDPTIDASRNKLPTNPSITESLNKKPKIITSLPKFSQEVPKEDKNLKFILKKVNIVGLTAFDHKAIEKIYAPLINKTINLAKIYEIVNEITMLYKQAGYFMSLAELPEQKISIQEGTININIIEGYIKEIAIPKELEKFNKKLSEYVDPLLQEKPITVKLLESTLLSLNDLFGYKFNGVITTNKELAKGAIILSLNVSKEKPKNLISIDNYAAKLTGPHQISINNTLFLSPFNKFNIGATAKLFKVKDVNQIILNNKHKFKKFNLDLAANLNKIATEPMTNINTVSKSKYFSAGINYQLIRQRGKNLNLNLSLNLRQSKNYVSDLAIKQDNIKTLKLNTIYDVTDDNFGYHFIDLTFTKGINILLKTKQAEQEKSRALATPNFSKLELNYSYWNALTEKFSLSFNLYSQYTYNYMYSAEEFGYGGQNIGRAFDNSEITGDYGLAGIVELNYNKLKASNNIKIIPYVFYDIGKIWRKDPNRAPRVTGASAGFGARANLYKSINTNLGLAWPIIKKISRPIYGSNINGPRITWKIALDW